MKLPSNLLLISAILFAMLSPLSARAAAVEAKGSLVKFQTDSRVYVVSDDAGTLQYIPSEAEFIRHGFNFANIVSISDALMSNYSFGGVLQPLDAPASVVIPTTSATPPALDNALVFVFENQSVVADIGGDTRWCLASISKLMTALVLHDLNLDWNKAVVQAKVDEVGGSRLRVAVGAKYKRIDLLHASLMGSANNSTHALARTSGLTMPQFVARMNAKAKALGMNNTRFVEPTGLSPENVSTAKDIAILVEAANRIPRLAAIGKKTSYTLRSVAAKPKEHTIKTTNKLLLAGENVALGKTGFIDESRYNFTVVGKGPTGLERTVVVLNAPSSAASFKIAQHYIDLEK